MKKISKIYKNNIKAILSVMMLMFTYGMKAQSWVTWNPTNSSSTFSGTTTINNVTVNISGNITSYVPSGDNGKWNSPTNQNNIANSPTVSTSPGSTTGYAILTRQIPSIIAANAMHFVHTSTNYPNKITYTITTVPAGVPIKITRFVTTDIDGSNSGNTYKAWDDSFSVDQTFNTAPTLYAGNASDWANAQPVAPTLTNNSIKLGQGANNTGDGKGVFYFELTNSNAISTTGTGGVVTQTFTGNQQTQYTTGNRSNEVVVMAMQVDLACTAPSISTNPASTQSVCQNAIPTNLSVTASGTSPLTYQWYSNINNSSSGGTVISGATSSTYTPSTSVAGTIYYYVVVSNPCGSATSNIASVVVSNPSTVGTASSDQTVCPGGDPAAISITNATGTIQWQRSTDGGTTWNNISGAASLNYDPPSGISQTTKFRAVVTSGACASVTSNIVTVTVSASATASAPALSGSSPFNSASNTYMIACNGTTAGSTGDLSGITGTNLPAGGTLGWFSSSTPSTSTKYASVSAVGPGIYYGAYYDSVSGCYSPNTTAVKVYKELCVTPPTAITVLTGTSVSRNIATSINANGGSGTYSYTMTTGCTAPAGAAGTISNVTINGSIANYTAPSTVGTYYYCVSICDTGNPQQCKTVTVPVNVTDSPTFACDNAVYLSKLVGNHTEIYKVVHNNTSVDIILIGSSASGIYLNDIAYNTADSKLYGIGSHGILKVVRNASTNAVVEVFPGTTVSGLPATSTNVWNYDAGGFYNGNLYVQPVGSSNVMYSVNISTNTATAIPLRSAVDLGDFVYSSVAGAFVGYDNATKKMIKIDPVSGNVTFLPYINTGVNEMGAVYTGGLGHVYGKDGTTGILYEFNLTTGQAYRIYQDNQFIMTDYDGAHCPTADVTLPLDVQVTKTASNSTYTPGDTVTFTIVVKNNSTIYAANNVAVTDTMPAALTNVTYYATASTGSTTNASTSSATPSTGNISDNVYLPAGGTVTYTINAKASGSGSISNTVDISVPANFSDTNANNNSATATISTSVCYKPATLAGVSEDTKHGITALQRAGENATGQWPLSLKGGYTALEANTKGFVINRLTTAQLDQIVAAGNAVEGMAAYDVTVNCLKIYDGTSFKCYKTPSCN